MAVALKNRCQVPTCRCYKSCNTTLQFSHILQIFNNIFCTRTILMLHTQEGRRGLSRSRFELRMELDTNEIWMTNQLHNLYVIPNYLSIGAKSQAAYKTYFQLLEKVVVTSIRRSVSSLPTNDKPAFSSCDTISGFTYKQKLAF